MSDGPTIRVGTASWTDPTLTKESDWYPKRSMSAEERLRYYADRFPLVEVDATYYYPPSDRLAAMWTERTPPSFRFDIKAYGLLTGHPARADSVWQDVREMLPDEHRDKRNTYLTHLPDEGVDLAWERFREALMPLHSAGKLGAVFFQFPPWFVPNRENRQFLDELPDRLPDYDLAVEFRHPMWVAEEADRRRTLDVLQELGIAYTCVDEPQGFGNSVPPLVAWTSEELAVVRMHGHNRENWNKKGISAAERFKYLYSDQELEAWAPKVQELAERTRETHVLFNNCYQDYGVRNAATLASMLDVGWSGSD